MKIRLLALLVMLLTSIMFAPSAFAQGKALVSAANGGNAAEPSTDGSFIVSIDKVRAFPTTVNYSVGGTAVAGIDYTALSGSVVVPATVDGELPTTSITVAVIDNDTVEPTRTVIITLTGTVGGSVDVDPDNDTATVDITSDDTLTSATLTLLKTVDNDDGGTAVDTDFTLTATGPVDTITGVEGDGSITSAVVGIGVYTLTESAVSGYTNAGWVCTGAQTDGGDGTVTLADTDVATCTVTNTDDPPPSTATLTLLKTVVNDEGGTAVDTDFTLTATGPVDTITGVEGDGSITSAVVGIGVYTLTESAVSGYTNAGWVCTGAQTDGGDGTVTLADTDVATCTVTNTDDTPTSATLTLLKTVVNDDGGTAVDTDFTLTATGPVDTITGVEGDGSITSAVVGIGVYTLTESAVSGYTNAGWVCSNGDTDGTVTLADTDVVTCTVTNTDDPPPTTATLTLLKTVVNDEGGTAVDTDFTLTATGPVDTITGVEGDASITSAIVGTGAYTLTESAVAGYTNAGWVCSNGDTDGTVTLADTDVVTCTVTNTDDTIVVGTATLTLLKTVVNDEGGTAVDTDFTLTATGPVDTITGVEGDASITSAVVGIGAYTLTESAVAGYTNAGWVCSNGDTDGTVTLADTDVVTCTVTNTDDTIVVGTATLTLLKTVVNDEGGTAVDTDFTLTATGPVDTITGVEGDASITSAVVGIGAYTLTESAVVGYTNAGWVCSNGDTDGTVTLADTDVVTCTVTNTDDTIVVETATLTLLKTVVNDEGGTAVDTDFTLTATGPVDTITGVEGDASITSAVVGTGTYTLTESAVAGYTSAGWDCSNGDTDGTVTLADTDVVTCTVTNNDLPPDSPLLTLVKTADPSSFSEVGQVINYSYLVSSNGNAPVIGPITVADSRMAVTCPPVNSVGNNDDNLDVGESLTCTSSTVVTLADISLGYILTTSTASGANASSTTVGISVPYVPAPIPTLSEWSMMLMSFLFLLMGVTYLRRRQVV